MPKNNYRTLDSLINELKQFDLQPVPINKREMAVILPVLKAIGRITLILDRLDNELSSQLDLIEALEYKVAGSPKLKE